MRSSLFIRSILSLTTAASMLCLSQIQTPNEAEACGCFVPPDPSVPIVQAGERILFAMKDGIVTSHIQVQYSGDAAEFGWLLPMPAIPVLELGVDELFTELISTTQPQYVLERKYNGDCPFDPARITSERTIPDSAGSPPDNGGSDGTPLVLRDSIGPYDYAVLKADKKQPMLDWLDKNGFFVPTGTTDAVGPYITEGSFFLALKLLKGSDVGDLQPVVVKYKSDLPMIPIILTGVAANPNMGVQVWVLGDDRAIPRNYHHTKINDAAIDWLGAAANYAEVVTDAVDEIEGHHSFVTEYAGSSDRMVGRIDFDGRFGMQAELAEKNKIKDFIQYLNNRGYPLNTSGFSPVYSSQLINILRKHFPMPKKLDEAGIVESDYYWSISYYLGSYRDQNPNVFVDFVEEFNAEEIAAELNERIVVPTLSAGQLFRENDYLSRLFTTLSPNEMTKDPVFSFNPDLPEVSNRHEGSLTYYCDLVNEPTIGSSPAVLYTEQGFKIVYNSGTGESTEEFSFSPIDMPQSQYQEILREEGKPEIVIDNTKNIQSALDKNNGSLSTGGCSTSGSGGQMAWLLLTLGCIGLGRKRKTISQ